MKLPSTIATFSIIAAHYDISDKAGARATLEINYADNSYSLLDNLTSSSTLERAASTIAGDLLARKHGVNFARGKD